MARSRAARGDLNQWLEQILSVADAYAPFVHAFPPMRSRLNKSDLPTICEGVRLRAGRPVTLCVGYCILIDSQQKRLARLSGQLINRVEFGFGFFGHIDNGGTNGDWACTGRTFTMEDHPDQHSTIRTSGVLKDNQQTAIRDPGQISMRSLVISAS